MLLSHIRPITAADTYPLRHTVLWPDKPAGYVQLPDDEQGFHYGTYLDSELVAVISLFINGNEARFRKFATRPDQQRKGLGTLLLQHVFAEARRLEATTFIATHASAQPLFISVLGCNQLVWYFTNARFRISGT